MNDLSSVTHSHMHYYPTPSKFKFSKQKYISNFYLWCAHKNFNFEDCRLLDIQYKSDHENALPA